MEEVIAPVEDAGLGGAHSTAIAGECERGICVHLLAEFVIFAYLPVLDAYNA
jgi:hypothetical protein